MDTQRRRPKAVYGKKGVASAYRGNAAQIFGGFSESSSSKPTHIRFPDTDCDVTPSEPPQPPPTRKQPRATATRDPLGDVSNRLAALNLGETVAPAVSSPKSQKRDKQSPVRTLQKPEKTEKLAQPTPKPKPTPRTTRPRSTPQTALATRTTRKTRSGHSQTDFLNSLPTWIEPLKIAGMKGVLNWGSLDSCTVTKIGEGSYAEVYRLSDSSTSTSSPEAIESIFKIIPLKPEKGPGSRREGCVAIKDVISELVIMMEMGVHNGFLEFKDCSILCGRPTANFRQAWKTYALGRTASEDDEDDEGLGFRDPKSWPIDQLFLSLELGDAGVTLERFPLADEDQAWDLVLETIVALAKGEEVAEFEHRDLHCSNICIRQRHQQCNPIKNGIKPTSASTAHKYGQSGLEVVFIDYTLSRAKTKNGETYFMDLESALEVHTWDVNLPAKNPMEKLQHETYRRMRNYVLFGQPVVRLPRDKVKASGKEWKEYKPYTNVLWVRYVVSYVIWKLENRLGLGQDGKGFMSGIRPLVERLDPNRAGRPERGGFGSAVEVLRFCVERGWITREDLSELGYECGDGSDAAGSE